MGELAEHKTIAFNIRRPISAQNCSCYIKMREYSFIHECSEYTGILQSNEKRGHGLVNYQGRRLLIIKTCTFQISSC